MWLEYAKTIEKKGKISLFRLFSEQFPKIDDNFLLHFPVESQALAEDIQTEKPELLTFLRESLNNYGIDIDFPVMAVEERKNALHDSRQIQTHGRKTSQIDVPKKTLGFGFELSTL